MLLYYKYDLLDLFLATYIITCYTDRTSYFSIACHIVSYPGSVLIYISCCLIKTIVCLAYLLIFIA